VGGCVGFAPGVIDGGLVGVDDGVVADDEVELLDEPVDEPVVGVVAVVGVVVPGVVVVAGVVVALPPEPCWANGSWACPLSRDWTGVL
jgi:hypothetical protein